MFRRLFVTYIPPGNEHIPSQVNSSEGSECSGSTDETTTGEDGVYYFRGLLVRDCPSRNGLLCAYRYM